MARAGCRVLVVERERKVRDRNRGEGMQPYYSALRRVVEWLRDLYYERGPEAEAQRARVLPLLEREPERRPDHVGLGPEAPNDEAARRRLFGEDCPC